MPDNEELRRRIQEQQERQRYEQERREREVQEERQRGDQSTEKGRGKPRNVRDEDDD